MRWKAGTLNETTIPGGVDHYSVYISDSSSEKGTFVGTTTPGALELTISKESTALLDKGRAYYIHVTVSNAVGESLSTSSDLPVKLLEQPTAVRELKASAPANTSFVLTWNPPENLGGNQLLNYIIHIYKADDLTTLVKPPMEVDPSETSRTVTGLTEATRYRIEMYAVGDALEGQKTYIEAATLSVPLAPQNLTVLPGTEGGDFYLDFDWMPNTESNEIGRAHV